MGCSKSKSSGADESYRIKAASEVKLDAAGEVNVDAAVDVKEHAGAAQVTGNIEVKDHVEATAVTTDKAIAAEDATGQNTAGEEAVDFDELEAPLSIAAARLSQWVYLLEGLSSEYIGTWKIEYEVLSSVEADGTNEDIQKANVAVTVTSAQQLTLTDASKRNWSCRVLFIVFRGTGCLQDWLQNVACVDNRVNFEPYNLGVHSGIWTYTANDFLQHGRALLELVSTESMCGTKLLIFTGHSLGGGLANVTHLLIQLALDQPDKLPCHEQIVKNLAPSACSLLRSSYARTFAAPMVFTPSQPELEVEVLLRKRTTNFVYNNDPVPRFPGELGFIEEIVRGCGSLKIPVTQGLSVDISSNIKNLAAEVPALSRYRHIGVVALVRGDGELFRGVGDEIGALLRQKRDPTEGGGIRNWWSANAYDAGLDHNMERYIRGLSLEYQAKNWQNELDGVAVADFGCMDLGDGGVLAMADALRFNATLACLDLCDNCIGDAGAASLAECLCANQTLKKLNLSRNHIGDEGAAALAAELHRHQGITEFNLRRNSVGEVGAKAIADALKENNILGALDLSDNHLLDAGAIALAASLTDNQRLNKLCLALNQIGDAGASALGLSLATNNRLKILDLACNLISDTGAVYLANTLKSTKCLKRLDLNDNQIGSFGETAIREALAGWAPATVDLHRNCLLPSKAI